MKCPVPSDTGSVVILKFPIFCDPIFEHWPLVVVHVTDSRRKQTSHGELITDVVPMDFQPLVVVGPRYANVKLQLLC